MKWILLCMCLLPLRHAVRAQFPYTRTLEIRAGQQRPAITSMAQDHLGLMWLGTDIGLLRTDGELVETMFRTEQGTVTAITADGGDVLAAFDHGLVIRCGTMSCDTLVFDMLLAVTPVRAMLRDRQGRIWLGTYGAGIHVFSEDGDITLDTNNGLRDDHINALVLLPDGRVAAATDQGVAICGDGGVELLFGEAEGAPDNLVLSLAVANDGMLWAGTDRRGVFRWSPASRTITGLLDEAWDDGEVTALAVHEGAVWVGTRSDGILVHEQGPAEGRYRHSGDRRPVTDLLADQHGAVWWCDGTEHLHRADAAILVVPAHEGVDLQDATALAIDPAGRIWFATRQGLYHHATAFAEDQLLTHVPVRLDPRTPIVSLAAAEDGTIWAGTFGAGAISITADGAIRYHTSSHPAMNDNVLSVRTRGPDVWMATFDGLVHHAHREGFTSHPLPSPGFVYDVLPMPDGSVLAATDGNGILRLAADRSGWEPMGNGAGTYYSLTAAGDGSAWAAGPGTGLCRVWPPGGACEGTAMPPFDGDLFALAAHGEYIMASGSSGTLVMDAGSGTTTSVASRLGLEGIQAPLNASVVDGEGAIWLATDRGLVRIRPSPWHMSDRVGTVITSISSGGRLLPLDGGPTLPHDHEPLVIRFTGIHYVDPTAVRFEYRIKGSDERGSITRDRELSLASLAPGSYTISIRAFTGALPADAEGVVIRFRVAQPLWQRPWFLLLVVMLTGGMILGGVKLRDRRLRERERMEQEKVRFQLEALRSQVDPHFLFNSFNTLVSLIESDTGRAVSHVDRLSQFFRNILQVRDRDLITVEEELRLLENYFSLEEHRFGRAIQLQVSVPGEDLHKCIVPLTLQLLVENALKHNIATLENPLLTRVVSDGAMIQVTNRIQPRLSPPRSTGFGLESIRKRYAALSLIKVMVISTEENFTVRIPLIQRKHEGAAHRG